MRFLAAALVVATATPLYAQTGRIVGQVSDVGSRGPIAGARVDALGTASRGRRAVSNDDGRYAIAELQAGHYTLVVTKLGRLVSRTETDVRAGETTTLDVALAPLPKNLD